MALERVNHAPATITRINSNTTTAQSQPFDRRAVASLRSIFSSSRDDLGAFMKGCTAMPTAGATHHRGRGCHIAREATQALPSVQFKKRRFRVKRLSSWKEKNPGLCVRRSRNLQHDNLVLFHRSGVCEFC